MKGYWGLNGAIKKAHPSKHPEWVSLGIQRKVSFFTLLGFEINLSQVLGLPPTQEPPPEV